MRQASRDSSSRWLWCVVRSSRKNPEQESRPPGSAATRANAEKAASSLVVSVKRILEAPCYFRPGFAAPRALRRADAPGPDRARITGLR